MGAPTANVTTGEWVCLDKAQVDCASIGDSTNLIAKQFNSSLQTQLAKWRRDLGKFNPYPMFSPTVICSFSIRCRGQGWFGGSRFVDSQVSKTIQGAPVNRLALGDKAYGRI
ncbi:MAG: hypothetical protein WAL75_00040 [Terracidiphilus sp.]